MSHISSDAELSGPRYQQAWRSEHGIHATVLLSAFTGGILYFDSAEDARAVAAACTEAAENLDRLAEPAGLTGEDGERG